MNLFYVQKGKCFSKFLRPVFIRDDDGPGLIDAILPKDTDAFTTT